MNTPNPRNPQQRAATEPAAPIEAPGRAEDLASLSDDELIELLRIALATAADTTTSTGIVRRGRLAHPSNPGRRTG